MDQQLFERLKQLNNISLHQIGGDLTAPAVGDACRTLLRALSGDASAGDEAKRICSEPFANAIHSVASDCLRLGIGPDELSREIESNAALVDNGLLNAFLDAYGANFDALKMAVLKSTDSAAVYPKVVGMDWSILSVVESTEGAEIEEPLAEIAFKTISPPGASASAAEELFKFVCNKNQLQDFQWKVKEACNFVQKLAAKEN
uniref:COMM domain-containing protein 3 n=1 Tax=Globodera rostochiensis TaxID=31243 RepID=A0A914GW76_GLORO